MSLVRIVSATATALALALPPSLAGAQTNLGVVAPLGTPGGSGALFGGSVLAPGFSQGLPSVASPVPATVAVPATVVVGTPSAIAGPNYIAGIPAVTGTTAVGGVVAATPGVTAPSTRMIGTSTLGTAVIGGYGSALTGPGYRGTTVTNVSGGAVAPGFAPGVAPTAAGTGPTFGANAGSTYLDGFYGLPGVVP